MSDRAKPITDTHIPGTRVPDIARAGAAETRDKKWMARVAVGTACLAALAAISSMFAGMHLNAAMLEQIHASDQWNFFQAKGLKHAVLESRLDMLPALGKTVEEADRERLARYKREQDEIKGAAEKHQALSVEHRRRNVDLGRSATAFQIAIALSAVALLTKRNVFWMISLAVGVAGVWFGVRGMMS